MRPGESAGGGEISQRDLDVALALRRRARDMADEARSHHRDLAARLLAGETSEPGRYRPAIARVRLEGGPRQGTIMFAIYVDDADTPVLVAAFNHEELD